MNLKSLLTISASLLFVSCRPTPSAELGTMTNSRITVTRVGIIKDSLAYESRRGIYIITDTETGREYIGVSGIGISETGQHGKVKDER